MSLIIIILNFINACVEFLVLYHLVLLCVALLIVIIAIVNKFFVKKNLNFFFYYFIILFFALVAIYWAVGKTSIVFYCYSGLNYYINCIFFFFTASVLCFIYESTLLQ